jgi:hypothetical protein
MVMSRRSAHRLFALGASDVDNPLQRMLDRRCDKRPDEQTLAVIVGPKPDHGQRAGAAAHLVIVARTRLRPHLLGSSAHRQVRL